MRGRLLIITLAVSVLALVAGAKALGAYQDSRINAVASTVAGHSVIVSCAQDSTEWSKWETNAGFTTEQDGFTYANTNNVIFLAPRICQTLFALYGSSHDDVGPYWAALAIKTLLHESIHQSGVINEAETDCRALDIVTAYAVSNFGYPATVAQTTYVKLRTGFYKRVIKTVPNPMLNKILYEAYQWHRAMPADYQGRC